MACVIASPIFSSSITETKARGVNTQTASLLSSAPTCWEEEEVGEEQGYENHCQQVNDLAEGDRGGLEQEPGGRVQVLDGIKLTDHSLLSTRTADYGQSCQCAANMGEEGGPGWDRERGKGMEVQRRTAISENGFQSKPVICISY